MKRVGIFGWGVVAPRSPNLESFARELESSESWLSSFDGFGPNNFLVGQPDFDFEAYRPWIEARCPPNRFRQLTDKMDPVVLFAVGCFIQALGQNPGLEEELKRLGSQAHVYVGTGLGSLGTIHDEVIALHYAQRRWNRFWSDPERNPELVEILALASSDERRQRLESIGAPPDPEEVTPGGRDEARDAWWSFWAARSPELERYLKQSGEIEGLRVEGNVAAGKMSVLKQKQRLHARLQTDWQAPTPPWRAVSANLLWNISNIPAAQISMLGHISGLTFSPVAACSTFGVSLKLAIDAIRRGEAKAVVVGATDPPPHPMTVSAFFNARVAAGDSRVSKPLSELRGTHVSGGAAVWIVGDWDHMTGLGFRPLGMEPLAVGTSSDADHIITPSEDGPLEALRLAFEQSGEAPESIGSWDLHATATPGDFTEVSTLRKVLPESVLVSSRKGTFGHGMAASGGWELTAQYLGYERGTLFPTPLAATELNEEIANVHDHFVFDAGCARPDGLAGKLSMGVGGVNACVVSRPLPANMSEKAQGPVEKPE